jgi:acyl-CoA thioesterase-2
VNRSWNRFADAETFDDPWIDACRSLIINSLYGSPACGPARHMSEAAQRFYSPTIELATRFVGDARNEPWLY